MESVVLPYGKNYITAEIPEKRLVGILHSRLEDYIPEMREEALVEFSLEHPIGTPKLRDMVCGKEKIVILASDHTRPVPSRVIIPRMLREIRMGNPQADITILIATGCHRNSTKEELKLKFGEEIVDTEKIVIHDCDDEENLVFVGKLPSGGELWINRIAAEADFLCAEGFIEPHFFAGFSGGRKSVLPGIASRQSVLSNHCASFIADPHARTGIVSDNPIHVDMLYAARAARLDFIVNVVLGKEKRIVYSVCGDCDLAHQKGREFLEKFCKVDAALADIVLSTNGGYPLDQNIYQAVKGMTAAEATVKQDGVIIMFARSEDGHGGEEFYSTFQKEKNLDQILETFLKRTPKETVPDQWQSQIFARVLKKARIIYVSDVEDEIVRELHMIPAHSVEEALKTADCLLKRKDGTITVIPDGVAVMIREKQQEEQK